MQKFKTRADQHVYVPAADPLLCTRHVVRRNDGDKGVRTYLYTDGASKGYYDSPDKRSFSGWGYVIHSISLARESRASAYGGMTNASSVEAEFFAVLKGISAVRYPADLHLVTDCAEVVACLSDLPATMARYHRIRATAPSQRSPRERFEMKYLNIMRKIDDEIRARENIRSLTVEWCRAHTLDSFVILPDPEDLPDPDAQTRLRRCLGNHEADQEAQKGATQAVRTALNFLSAPERHSNLQHHIMICRKNFAQSWFARDAAVRYLSRRPEFLTAEMMEAVLSEPEYHAVREAWAAYSHPCPEEKNPFQGVKRSAPAAATNQGLSPTC